MPRLKPDTILQRCIPSAIQDRKGLVDAYSGQGEGAEQARSEMRAIHALRGKALADMNEAERATAFTALCCAENWHQSLADAMGPSGRGELREASLIRTARLSVFGKSALEEMMARCVAVDVRDAIKIMEARAVATPPGAVT